MRYLITECDNQEEVEYKERYNSEFDERATRWGLEYFGEDGDDNG